MVTRTKTKLALTTELKAFMEICQIFETDPYSFAEAVGTQIAEGYGSAGSIFQAKRKFAIPQGTPVPQAVINLAKEYANA